MKGEEEPMVTMMEVSSNVGIPNNDGRRLTVNGSSDMEAEISLTVIPQSDDDDDGGLSSECSTQSHDNYSGTSADLMAAAMGDDVTAQLAAAGWQKPHLHVFSVLLPCSGHGSGTASFGIGLLIQSRKGRPLPGTPLRVKMRKECMIRGPDVECDKKCANGGWCNNEKICQCPEGYMGQHCNTALCYPACMNNGTCTAPGVCSCPTGYQGRHCEGGICFEKCLNGGKCVQKDTCECSKGYYGLRCEFSKCIIPCLNGGRCKGVNKCRCPRGFRGDHCEIGQPTFNCSRPCRHGTCYANDVCVCDRGWTGKRCNHRKVNSSEDLSIFDDEDDEIPINTHTRNWD